MGCGASAQRENDVPITRVVPLPQAVSEANTLTLTGGSQELGNGGISQYSKASLDKVNSLTDRASPEQVLQALLDGNARFISGASVHPHQDFSRVKQISVKQKPLAAILGCADSRVPAEIVFDQGFGDVFVCRVAGNIATPEQVASLEYAVLHVGVKVVMILGHTKCGAVHAALSGKAFPGFIDTLVGNLDVAIARVDSVSAKAHQRLLDSEEERQEKVVRENVKYQIQRCQRSTIIQEGLQRGKVLLAGAVYDLDTGRVHVIVTKGGTR
ncbi:hypothetical protein Agub_g7989 [Astrephomene gubernaculifera]|uniref:Carbonic anhydrase n=1 Tax=Astrephomene gubernaculifera TaxID=47775 RepID=A0AAD3DQY4_9CHLO|nr:hypothetical protein Agub_g7975 [Astrephomene gubernaculifera]GFR46406.1 hypothetical protein Agub_g7989 [Astrephomene gubernaculifera]